MTEKQKKKKCKTLQEFAVYYIQDVFKRIGRFNLEPTFALNAVLVFITCRFIGSWVVTLYSFLGFLVVWAIFIHWLEQSWVVPARWYDESWWWTLDGWQFEREVGLVFKRMGYKVEVTRGSGDGGVDIIMYKDGLKYIVQCKHYKRPLGPEAVRSLYGVRELFHADRMVMVASKGLTPGSREFVEIYKDVYVAYDLQDIIRMSLKPIDKKKRLW